MADKEEVAKQVLEYIKAGKSDDSLMEKYGPAYEGLHELFAELADAGFMGRSIQESITLPGQHVSARDIIKDIRQGAGRAELMDRYALSLRGLQEVLQQLADSNLMTLSGLPAELLSFFKSEVPANTRSEQRHHIDFELPVWEVQNPQVTGQVLDITERGIGILGLPAIIDEEKDLVIYSEEFLEIEPFTLSAVCRWVKQSEDKGTYVSGFQVSTIHEKDLDELRKLIQLLTL